MAPSDRARGVFLNMPYSRAYENLYLAYIAGVSAFGLVPVTALADASTEFQLQRVLRLISACNYSIHDVSWMAAKSRRPRYNMPFELGVAVAMDASRRNRQWLVFDTVPHRLTKTLSDLSGMPVWVHGRSPRKLFNALLSAFVRRHHRPTMTDLVAIYGDLKRRAAVLKMEIGSRNLFDPRAFSDLVVAANDSAHRHIASLRRRRRTAARGKRSRVQRPTKSDSFGR